MLKNFGNKVKNYRVERNLTKEDFCQDESELSIRQLTRIENNQSLPTLSKVVYIAKRLGMSVGSLTDGEKLGLPRRYQEIKFHLLRTPTYGDRQKLVERELLFDEIYNDYYEELPEDERLIVDALQSKLDIHFSGDINFGAGLLRDCFAQILRKDRYRVNDLIIIDLYFHCLEVHGLKRPFFCKQDFDQILETLLQQEDQLPLAELFILNNVLLNNFQHLFALKKYKEIKEVIAIANRIMQKTHDFHKKSVINVLEWKYFLHVEKNIERAKTSYQSALSLAQILSNSYLENRLQKEWEQEFHF